MTTQDREPEAEKEKRIAEQNKNKRVKISTGITELTQNTKSMTISSERVNTAGATYIFVRYMNRNHKISNMI